MSTFVSIHQAPGLSPEEIAGYAPQVKEEVHARFQNLYVNMDTGYIVTVYEGDSEADVRDEFDRIGWPVDTITEVQFVLDKAGLDHLGS